MPKKPILLILLFIGLSIFLTASLAVCWDKFPGSGAGDPGPRRLPVDGGGGGGGGTLPPPDTGNPGRNDPVIDGRSVYLDTGDFFFIVTDLTVPSRGFPFQFKRLYRSKMGTTSALGTNWDFSYNRHLAYVDSQTITLFYGIRGDLGNTDRALLTSDTYTYDGGSSRYVGPSGNYDFIVLNPDTTYSLKKPRGEEWAFFGIGDPNAGKLKTIKDQNNNEMKFTYTAGRLSQITDTLNRNYTLAYDANGYLRTLTDFSGRVITYSIDSATDLRSVTMPPTPDSPSGRITRYTYSSGIKDNRLNHNLLTITDPENQIYLTNTFGINVSSLATYDKVLTQRYGAGTFFFSYFPSERRTRVTDRNGNIGDWFYNTDGTILKQRQYTNRNVNPADPVYFETLFSHNALGERSLTTFPRGNTLAYAYDELNSDPRSRGNVTQVVRTDGPVGGLPDTVVGYAYESVFQQTKTITNARGNSTTLYYDYEEATLGDLNADGRTDQAHGNVVKIQLPGPENPFVTIAYNDFGQPLMLTRPEGNRDSLAYFAAGPSTGYLQTIVRDVGGANISYNFAYDAVGNVTSFTDGRGNSISSSHNALDQVVQTVGRPPLSVVTDFTYGANGNVIRRDQDNKDQNGVPYPPNPRLTSTFTYDTLGNLTSETHEVDPTKSVTTSYSYDLNENLIRTTQPLANKERTVFDERDLPYQTTRGEGSVDAATISQTYDGNGNRIRLVDGQGNSWQFGYDGLDRLFLSMTPLGFTSLYEYDENGNLVSRLRSGYLIHSGSSNVRLEETRYAYDEIDRQTQMDEFFFDPATQAPFPDGPNTPGDGKVTTQYLYDLNSNLVRVIDDQNHHTIMTYDGVDRLRTFDTLDGADTTYTYDANGNIIQKRDVEPGLGDYIIQYDYDGMDRLIQSVLQPSRQTPVTTNYEYDSRDNLVHLTEPKGNTSTFTYDGLNRQLQSQHDLRAGGTGSGAIIDTVITTQRWDDNSRLQSQTDDNGNSTVYAYDSLNRLRTTTSADGTTSGLTYDQNDNVLTSTDQNGSVVTNTYDNDNRLVARNIARAPDVYGPTTETFGYDGLNRITRAERTIINVTKTYDSFGNPLTETQENPLYGYTYQVSRTYDGLGNERSVTYPSGRLIEKLYDSENRTTLVRNSGGSDIGTDYYAGNAYISRILGNSTRMNVVLDFLRRAMIHIDTIRGDPANKITHFNYDYDQASNRRYEQKVHAPWIVGPSARGDVFIYDSLSRLVTEKLGVDDPRAESQNPGTGGNIDLTKEYTLDGADNRTTVTENGLPTTYSRDNTLPEPADFQVNQYTAVGPTNSTYDKNGNLKTDGQFNYLYDYRNQLLGVEDDEGGTVALYHYDALGRLVMREAPFLSAERYIYDGDNVIEQRNGLDEVVATNVWSTRPGDLMSLRRSGQDYYLHKNDLGSTAAITDSAANIVERYDYDAFGKTTFRDGSGSAIPSSTIGSAYLYAGQRFDELTGLYNSQGRLYQPALGQFLQRDIDGMWGQAMNLGNARARAGHNALRSGLPITISPTPEQLAPDKGQPDGKPGKPEPGGEKPGGPDKPKPPKPSTPPAATSSRRYLCGEGAFVDFVYQLLEDLAIMQGGGFVGRVRGKIKDDKQEMPERLPTGAATVVKRGRLKCDVTITPPLSMWGTGAFFTLKYEWGEPPPHTPDPYMEKWRRQREEELQKQKEELEEKIRLLEKGGTGHGRISNVPLEKLKKERDKLRREFSERGMRWGP